MLGASWRGTARGMWEALKEIGVSLPWEEFQAFFLRQKLVGVSLDTVYGGWDQLLQYWAERHPREAIAWAETQRLNTGPTGPDEIFQRMVQAWGQVDKEAALAYARQVGLGSSPRGAEVISTLERLATGSGSGGAEPESVASILAGLRHEGMLTTASMEALAALETAPYWEDKPLLSRDELRALLARAVFDDHRLRLLACLVRHDPREALQLAATINGGAETVWTEWSKADPRAALAAAQSDPDQKRVFEVMENALTGLARTDPNAANEWVNNQSDPAVWSQAVPRLLKSMPAENAVATVKFLLAEPVTPEMQQAIVATVINLGHDDVAASAAAVRTVLEQLGVVEGENLNLSRWEALPEAVRMEFQTQSANLLQSLNWGNARAALSWANDLAALFRQPEQVAELAVAFQNWAAHDAAAAANWLANSRFSPQQRTWIAAKGP